MAKEKKEEARMTVYEKARLIGARALQLSMGAPPLVKVPAGIISAVKLAFIEFEKSAIPLKVTRV